MKTTWQPTIKVKTILLLVLLFTTPWARASVNWSQTFTPADGTIVEGNPTGQVFPGDFTAASSGDLVQAISVSLNISGGYNGDFYAYLEAPNGIMTLLMNQPGVSDSNPFGASGAGMNITLSDASPNGSIQFVAGDSVLSGSYQPASPLATFNQSSANGDWTLFFADLDSGGGNALLNSWSLGITVVPEPVNAALGGLVVMLLLVAGIRWLVLRGSSLREKDGKL